MPPHTLLLLRTYKQEPHELNWEREMAQTVIYEIS